MISLRVERFLVVEIIFSKLKILAIFFIFLGSQKALKINILKKKDEKNYPRHFLKGPE